MDATNYWTQIAGILPFANQSKQEKEPDTSQQTIGVPVSAL
jgi:hypothetical protein